MACFLDVYVTSITGDCSNTSSGAFTIDILGTAPDYTISWLTPSFGTIPLGSGVTTYTTTGLTGGSYVFEVLDSCSGSSSTFTVSVNISTGTCVSISGIQNTTCNLDNGILTASTINYYGTQTFDLYDSSNNLLFSLPSNNGQYIFNSLPPGTYYVIADNGGGCTGKSESCIIKSSTTLNFGFYKIDDAGCAVDSGALYITGLTGVPPYSYLWSPNGETTSSITGLSPGNYSVTITDGSGCVTAQATTISEVPPVGLGTFTVINPSCFSSDGSVSVTITGGTAPYYYSGSNGYVEITFANTLTFTGVPSGFFSVNVTDAGLCSFNATTTLLTPSSFTNVTISTTNSLCNNNSGQISVSLFGGSPPYSYTLIDFTGNSATTITNATSNTFLGLNSGNYTIQITDGGPCVFTQNVTINNTVSFTINSSVSATTCDLDNGVISVTLTSGGTPPYIYQIEGASVTTSLSGYTFSGLAAGNYTLRVIDDNLCEQIQPIVIPSSLPINFILNPTPPILGNDGIIETFITEGEPPFTLNWSSNVPLGQTGLTVTGLSAGTYVLSITDDNGCTQTRSTTLNGLNLVSSYEVFNMCNSDFENKGQIIQKGLQQMLIEGFFDLTTGDTNCLLSSATFVCEVTVNGVSNSIGFYVSNALNDFPTDTAYFNAIESLLLLYPEIESVDIDPVSGLIVVRTLCNPSLDIVDATVIISVKIFYDINCETIGPP